MKFKDFIVRKVFVEMDKTYADAIDTWFRDNPDELPFNHLFKEGQLRILVPFQSKKKLAFKNKLEEMGFKVDFERGMVSKEVETQQGKRSREQKIGRLLSRSKDFDKDTLDWWSTFAGQGGNEDEYAIIISRAPIDVLRMSDHSGIESCHSQGGEYFKCALSEAKGGGGIAYLVDADEIKGWSDEDLQREEIFDDPDRIYGRERANMIQPLARVRLRLFRHREDDYDLAVPERSTYGDRVEGFLASVVDWAHDSQQNVLKGQRPRVHDFSRYGGSYQDNNDGSLFNQLFKDNEEPYANASYEGEDDYSGQFDQYEEEARGFHDAYANFDHDEVSADWDIHDDGEGPHVSFSGTVIVKFPKTNWLREPPSGHHWTYRSYYHANKKDKEDNESWEEAVNRCFEKNSLHSERNIHVEYSAHTIDLHFEIRSDEEGHPDDYMNFLTGQMEEIDDNYGGFVLNCKEALQETGWLGDTEMDKWMAETDKLFKNFEWDWDESEYTMDIDTPYQLVGDLKDINPRDNSSVHPDRPEQPHHWRTIKWDTTHQIQNNHPGFREFYEVYIRQIMQYMYRLQQSDRRQLSLPGMPRRDFARKVPLNSMNPMTLRPKPEWQIDYDRNVYLRLRWSIPMGDHAAEKTIDYLKWLDERWDWAAKLAIKVFNATVKRKYSDHAKRLEDDHQRDQAFAQRLEKGEVKWKIGEPRSAFGNDPSTPAE